MTQETNTQVTEWIPEVEKAVDEFIAREIKAVEEADAKSKEVKESMPF